MIPYFELTSVALGPVRIQVWGFFVALGIAVATIVARRIARHRDLDTSVMLDIATWAIIGAFIGARLGHAFLYEPARFIADPVALFRVWEGGFSSIGGFAGAAVAFVLGARVMKVSFWSYAEVAAFVLPLGLGIGRIGCFLIHDHPGTLSHSLLAVEYPGGARLDHGLLLSLLGFSLFLLFVALRPVARKYATPFYLPLLMVLYGMVRILLDSFRAWDLSVADARYLFWTPAQYAAALLMIGGVAVYAVTNRRTARGSS